MCSMEAKDPMFHHADRKDSDQTADAKADLSLRCLHIQFVGLSCRGSNMDVLFGSQKAKHIIYKTKLHYNIGVAIDKRLSIANIR